MDNHFNTSNVTIQHQQFYVDNYVNMYFNTSNVTIQLRNVLSKESSLLFQYI